MSTNFSAQKHLKQKTAAFEKELVDLKQEVKDKFTVHRKIKELTYTVLDLMSMLAFFRAKLQKLKEILFASLQRLDKSAIAVANAEQGTSDLRT